MQFVFWVISILVIAALCYWVYRVIQKSDSLPKQYYALLRQLANDPSNEEIRQQVFAVGRRYYRNRMTGIDVSIERDIDKAMRGEIVEEYKIEDFKDEG
ncbi:hypothetical protein [Alicyclobacillus dauci]|uniref:Uncharacterized protein n=1 Tax=Alicyclobacillus dauci TaxID=1475485 RepID=A0ABY6Z4B3_9BACL|nr:hypothetical protein [Alicyclobacillus dauci]WAH37599.1 hypothetical protein NZD86_03455 [Alicyclobacillus dauci]